MMARQMMRVLVGKDSPTPLRECVRLLIWPIQKKIGGHLARRTLKRSLAVN